MKVRTVAELVTWLSGQIAAGALSPDAIVKTSDLYGSTNQEGGAELVIHPPEGGEAQILSIYGEWA